MNQLKVSLHQSIAALHQKDWPKHWIAHELGVDRGSINRYLDSKLAISPLGSEGGDSPKPAISPLGSSTPSFSGRRSHCLALSEVITAACEAGLSALSAAV